MNWLRPTTFVVALLVSLAITFWPPLLYGEGGGDAHGATAAILAGLCAGIVYGSGILNRAPRPLQLGCAVAAWLATAAVAVTAS